MGLSRRQLMRRLGSMAPVTVASAPEGYSHFEPPRRENLQSALHSSTRVPRNDEDPLIIVNTTKWAFLPDVDWMGWGDVDRQRAIREILRLDPDFIGEHMLTGFDGPPGEAGYAVHNRVVRDFAYRYGMPFEAGTPYFWEVNRIHENWYRDQPDEKKWTHPDGTLVEHPKELAARDYHDEFRELANYTNDRLTLYPSIFADGTIEFMGRVGRDIFDFGANQFWVDAPAQPLTSGLDYSHWAQSAFREYLRTLSDSERSRLGIDDPTEFDIRAYLEGNGLAPGETRNPADDPVFREYNLFQHRSQKRFMRAVFETAREDLPTEVAEGGTSVHGLGFWLQYRHLDAGCIYGSDLVDTINVETQFTIPPERPHDLTVKTARAAGRFEKSVQLQGDFSVSVGLEPTRTYPTLNRFHLAQAYSHGGRRDIRLTSLVGNPYDEVELSWMTPEGTIPESLHRFTDFIRSHRRFLTEVFEANRTAVAVSLPTLLWRAPDWGRWRTTHEPALGEAAVVLRREHIPYDVQILDYPPLWAAPEQTDALAEYDVVILPGVECLTDRHVGGIETALANGATVIATGGAPARDEHYQPRSDVREMLDRSDDAVVIDSEPTFEGGGPSASELKTALGEDRRQIELGIDRDVSVNLFRQTDPDRVVVHLLNFEYDRRTDGMQVHEDVTLHVRDLPFTPEAGAYYTVDGRSPLDVDGNESEVKVEIPRLEIWGFVALGNTESALAPETDETTAASAIERAEAAIRREERDGLVQAKTKLENAERAFTYGAYTVAFELAEDALRIVQNRATEPERSPRRSTDTPTGSDPSPGTPPPSSRAPETDPTTVSEQGPGFGVLAALAGFGSAIASLVFHRRDE